VDYTSYCEATSEADPDDEWSRESTSTTHTVSGLKLTEGKDFDVVGAFVPHDDDGPYHLVSVVYSTGDSFGHDESRYIEFIQVFKTLEKAQECVEEIRKNEKLYNAKHTSYMRMDKEKLKELEDSLLKDPKTKKYEHDYNVCFKDEAGNIQKISAPWNGYFESISSVEIDSFELKKKLKYKI